MILYYRTIIIYGYFITVRLLYCTGIQLPYYNILYADSKRTIIVYDDSTNMKMKKNEKNVYFQTHRSFTTVLLYYTVILLQYYYIIHAVRRIIYLITQSSEFLRSAILLESRLQ